MSALSARTVGTLGPYYRRIEYQKSEHHWAKNADVASSAEKLITQSRQKHWLFGLIKASAYTFQPVAASQLG